MKPRIALTITFLAALIFLTPLAAHAADVEGQFTGKVSCQNGKKRAEFKSEMTMQTNTYSSEDIKRRIDDLSWPSSTNTLSFTDREKEKTTLQHALKMLRDLDCDAEAAPAAPQLPQALPPALSSGPGAHH